MMTITLDRSVDGYGSLLYTEHLVATPDRIVDTSRDVTKNNRLHAAHNHTHLMRNERPSYLRL